MKKAARIALLLGSALAFALAFPPHGSAWTLLVAWPCFLFALRGLSPSVARGAGFLWGMTAFGASVTWFWDIFEGRSLGLFAILAVFPALFGGVMALAEKRGWKGLRLVLFCTLTWTSLEFIRCEIFWLKFPWLSIGSALQPNGLHPLIGTYGIGLIWVGGMACIVLGDRRQRLAGCMLSIAIPLTPYLPSASDAEQPSIRVCGIQAEAVAPEEYLRLTELTATQPQIVIWPEYAIPFDLRKSKKLFSRISDFSTRSGTIMVVGTQSESGDGGWHNTALTFSGSQVLGEHHKVHTVHLFADGTPGKTALPVKTAIGKIGTPICFDCDFQDIVREMTLKGAEFFAVPIMDAVSWGLRQHLQHAHLFRLRAAENRRWMAVVGTSGVSQIIDPRGKTTHEIAPMKPGILEGSVSARTDLTFFTRFGWIIPWCQFPALGWMLLSLWKRPSSN
jgi:apolipoprotein N-acyltransferase